MAKLFIHLDNNIFDWIERNIGKVYYICKSVSKYTYICLICGDKVCHPKNLNNHAIVHSKLYGEGYCLFVDMNNMKLILINKEEYSKELFPIYINKEGTGPNRSAIGTEFNLSYEKLNLAIKNYVCKLQFKLWTNS